MGELTRRQARGACLELARRLGSYPENQRRGPVKVARVLLGYVRPGVIGTAERLEAILWAAGQLNGHAPAEWSPERGVARATQQPKETL